MTGTAAGSAEPLSSGTGWYRWGWLVGGIWLVFLVFPVLEVMSSTAGGRRFVGLLLIGAFAAVYAASFQQVLRHDESGWSHAPWVLAVLTGLVGGVALIIHSEALSMTPFLLAFSVWGFRWPVGAYIAGTLGAVGVALTLVTRAEVFLLLPILLVLGFTTLMRAIQYQSVREGELSELMAVVAERERVARDVHDVLGHSLTAISVKAELAQRLLTVDSGRAERELGEVQTLARDALAEIRSTVAGLRATRIEDELEVARESLTAAGISPQIRGSADDVEVANRVVLAWALRESVTNVIRHSGARRCVVTLGPATLVVTDDGDRSVGAEGNGLRGLRERVSASGGSVSLGPGPDGGGHELRVEL